MYKIWNNNGFILNRQCHGHAYIKQLKVVSGEDKKREKKNLMMVTQSDVAEFDDFFFFCGWDHNTSLCTK